MTERRRTPLQLRQPRSILVSPTLKDALAAIFIFTCFATFLYAAGQLFLF
jgi:hypothetical protein